MALSKHGFRLKVPNRKRRLGISTVGKECVSFRAVESSRATWRLLLEVAGRWDQWLMGLSSIGSIFPKQ